MRKVILILMVLCSTVWTTRSQSLSNSRRSSFFTYVFRLNAKEVKQLYRYKFDENVLLQRQPVDSFLWGTNFTKNLPAGNYLFVQADGTKLNFRLFSKSSLRAEVMNNSRDLMIYVFEKETGKCVNDASVKIGRKKVNFNKDLQVYFLPNTNRKSIITITRNADTSFYQGIWRDGFYNRQEYPFKKNRYHVGNEGFIAFNKPKYLPGDTLKWKAFILKANRRPLNREIEVSLSDRYSCKYKEIATLKPVSKGSYVHEYVLKDSLKINTWYVLQLKKKGRNRVLQQSYFYLEDYQLDETTYSLKSNKEKYYYGDSLIIIVSGKDANGMNLLDSKVDLEVRSGDVHKYIDDKVFVPDLIWTVSKVLEPSGDTRFAMPPELLPATNMELNIDAAFKNSNNETHVEKEVVEYLGYQKTIIAKVDSDAVVANYFEKGKSASTIGSLFAIYKNDTLFRKQISLPYTCKLNDAVSRYVFIAGTAKAELDLHESQSLVDINYNRTKDSLNIRVDNPRKLEFRYFINKQKHRLLEKGTARQLNWSLANPGLDSYYIDIEYMWRGRAEKESREIHFYKNNLNVGIQQPTKVFPGEKVNIKVKVTDYLDNPVKDVNITSNAINAQFKNVEVPDVPYFGKAHRSLPHYNGIEIARPIFDYNTPLTNSWIDKMGLDRIPYYKIHFPDGFSTLLYDSIKSNSAQFAPYVFIHGVRETIYLVFLDEEPVYYCDLFPSGPYSFKGKAGYHSIRIRLWDKEIKVDSVLLISGKKLELSLELTKLPASMVINKERWTLAQEDLDKLNLRVMWLSNNFLNQICYLWQKDHVVKLDKSSGWDYRVGFFTYDSIHFALKDGFKTDFFFEPGYEYTIGNKLIKMRTKPKYSLISHHLPYSPNDPPMGEVALEFSDIQLKSPPRKDFLLYEQNSNSTNKGNGTFILDYNGDSLVSQVVVYSQNTEFNPRFYKGMPTAYFDLKPGYYNFLFQTESKNYMMLDSVYIQANGRLFQRVSDLKYNKLPTGLLDTINKYESNWTRINPIRHSNVSRNFGDYSIGTGNGAIRGKIFDKQTREPIPFANVVIENGPDMVRGSTTDFDGNFIIKPVTPGKYDLKVIYMGYNSVIVRGVIVNSDKITFLDVEMESTTEGLNEICLINYRIPLISKDRASTGGTLTLNEIAKMPNRSADAIATTVGGVFSADGERSSVRGQHAESTVMYIEGVRIRNPNDLPMNAIDNFVGDNNLEIPMSSIRSDFNDCGYWVPNLLTDKNGETSFDVKFPDNITTWKSWALAINDNKQSGIGYTETKAMKNLQTNLALPRFLIQGDQCNVIGKALNYSGQPQLITTEFRLNNQVIHSKQSPIRDVIIDTARITAQAVDSLTIRYALSRPDGYFDGEERKIPVFPVGVEETKGEFKVMNRDTTMTINLPADSKEITVYAQNNLLETMLKDLDQLKDYPYWCMEQTASKLKAYLMERRIDKKLDRNFMHEAQIRKLISRLEKGQKEDGSWGWWENSPSNIWMTTYVIDALMEALNSGYKVFDFGNGLDFLLNHRDQCQKDDLLRVLITLASAKVEFPVASYIEKLLKDSLSTSQKISLIRIKQLSGLPYDIQELLALKKQTIFGSFYWGEDADSWYNTRTNSTLEAYKVIETSDSLHPVLQNISNYFLELKSNKQWYNTIITAGILSTILPAQLRNSAKTITPVTLTLSGASNQIFTEFPVEVRFPKVSNQLTVHKTGTGPMFFTAYSKSWNPNPSRVDSIFEVKSWFEVEKVRVDSLRAGVETELLVEVNARKAAEYCMLEIPIPAGCSYGDNSSSTGYHEAHREYFKNKTNIFCEKVSQGKHVYRVKLQPRYTGAYTLNPAKFEQMYFPAFYGRNVPSKVEIK